MKYCYFIYSRDEELDRLFGKYVEPVVVECGYTIANSKEQEYGNFVETIEKMIMTSDLCVADISAFSPNVWYEIGYACAKGKTLIFIASSEEEVMPYSRLKFLTITCENKSNLKNALRNEIHRIQRAARHPSNMQKSTTNVLSELEMSILRHTRSQVHNPQEVVPHERVKASDEDVQSAIIKLVDDNCLEFIYFDNPNGERVSCYRLTEKGKGFLDGTMNNVVHQAKNNNSASTDVTQDYDGNGGVLFGQVSGGTVNVFMNENDSQKILTVLK